MEKKVYFLYSTDRDNANRGGTIYSRFKRNPLHCVFPVTLLLAAALLLACGHSSDSAPSYAATMAEGRAAAREVMDETGASALSLALVDGERVIWAEGFGWADKAAGRAAAPDTLFGIGSVSKMFATAAAMILVEKWNVSLEEPLITYLPAFRMASPEYRDITVRMLLNHSAGYPGGDARGALTSAPFTGYAAQVMEGLTYQRLKHTPGYMSVYSNDCFTMIENLVEAVTGVSYPQFVQDQILEPLGMVKSRYNTDDLPDGSYAKIYREDTLLPNAVFNFYASGGLYSTAPEMGRLAMMLINKGILDSRRILSNTSVEAMAQDQTLGSFNPLPEDTFRYGLGWDTVAQPGFGKVGIKAWQKGGNVGGPYGQRYGATLIVLPKERMGVVVLGASGITSALAGTVGERVLLRALVERGRLREMPAQLSQAPLPARSPTAEEKAAYGGFYAGSGTLFRAAFAPDDSVTVELRDNGVWKPEYQGLMLKDLKLRTDGWYAADADSVTALRFLTRAGRTYFALRLPFGAGHYSITVLQAQKLEDRQPLSDAWQARIAESWVMVNDDFYASFPDAPGASPGFSFAAVEGLPGYILLGTNLLADMTPPTTDRLDGMFLRIPQGAGRDLVDAAIESRETEEWIRLGSVLLRPLSGVPAAPAGPTTVTIGAEGYAEWRKLPPAGQISIGDCRAWNLYNIDKKKFMLLANGSGAGTAVLPGSGDAAYLLLFGAPGATINLTLDAAL